MSFVVGSRQLVWCKVLVKWLVTIEDFGNIEILFIDKIGILIEGVIIYDVVFDVCGDFDFDAVLLGLLCNDVVVDVDGWVDGNVLDVVQWYVFGVLLLLVVDY